MAETTGIEWCDHTLNFWIGCQEASPACDHCYARVQNEHRKWVAGWGPHGERRRTAPSTWHQLHKWNREAQRRGVRDKVFSNSLADFFDKAARPLWRREAWHLIEQCQHLDFLILTKRPQNIAAMLPDPGAGVKPWGDGWPNVWLGTTVENQTVADRRIPQLLAVPAVKHFLSCEPLLGPLSISSIYAGTDIVKPLAGVTWYPTPKDWPVQGITARHSRKIDWVICGGESGKGARPMHPDWARGLRDQCAAAGVPFFFKQWGEHRPVGAIHDENDTYADAINSADEHRSIIVDRRGVEWHELDGQPPATAWMMERVGKKRAGALLDGVQHKEFPA
jgi:protein gp37